MTFISRHKIPLLLLLLGLLLFSNTLGADRLRTWDDNRYLDENGLVKDFQISKILTEPYFGAYIPVTLLSFALEHKLWGLTPTGYHAVNMLLHALNGVLVYLFLFQFTGRRPAAVIGAVLFICHPAQVESVAWISQRKNLLSMFFFLLAFISHIRARQKGSTSWLIAAWTFFSFSMLSKSAVVGAPLLFMAYDHFWARLPIRRTLLSAVPPLAIALFGALSIVATQADVGGILDHWGGSRWAALQLTFLVTWEYLVGIINPATLNVHYLYVAPDAITGNWRVWSGMLLLVLFACLGLFSLGRAVRDKSRHPMVFFVFLWVTLFMLPVSNIVPINIQRADRYIYFPSIVLFGMAGMACQWLWQRYQEKSLRYVMAGVGAALVLFFMAGTFNLNRVWANDGTLWSHQLQNYPNDIVGINNLAMHHYINRQYPEAITLYSRSAKMDPYNFRPALFLGLIASQQGRYEDAIAALRRALPLAVTQVGGSKKASPLGSIKEPFIQIIHEELILAYIEAITAAKRDGRNDKAAEFNNVLNEAAQDNLETFNNLGNMLFQEKRYAQALVAFETVLGLNPYDALPYVNKGIAAYALGEKETAEAAFKRALEIDGESQPALESYCTFLQETSGDAEAICRKMNEIKSR